MTDITSPRIIVLTGNGNNPYVDKKFAISAADAIFSTEHFEGLALALQKTLDALKTEKKGGYDTPSSCIGSNCTGAGAYREVWQHTGPQRVEIQVRQKPEDGKPAADMPVVDTIRLSFSIKE